MLWAVHLILRMSLPDRHRPSTSAAAAPGTLLALAEGAHVSLWDVRSGTAATRWGSASPAHVLALAAAAAPAGYPLLASCGVERALVVYDARAARPLRRINGLMRKDVTSLCFSSVDARTIYAAGADNEVICRRWDVMPEAAPQEGLPDKAASARGWAFRGEARWAGLAVALAHAGGGGDLLAAWSASGVLTAAHVTAS